MALKKNTPHSRKNPSQQRSRATVEVILQATQECLEKGGLKELNTTAVAKRAGVSVGTLYQYYPNRESLVAALVENIGLQENLAIETLIEQSSSLDQAVADIIRLYFQVVAQNQRLYLPLMHALYRVCNLEDIHRLELAGVKRMEKLLRKFQFTAEALERTAFIMAYTFLGLLRFSSNVRPENLTNSKFIDQVIQMTLTCLH